MAKLLPSDDGGGPELRSQQAGHVGPQRGKRLARQHRLAHARHVLAHGRLAHLLIYYNIQLVYCETKAVSLS